ncbi:MAG: ATP-binding protein [Phascolarctobacterium sp.]|nr:ATP-binding protein [Candidatus Phascolarctobacterium caballi]
MPEWVKKEIPARSFMQGLRAIGYNFATAVADIIDNSVSAGATKIDIISEPLNDAYFCILDNGCGMNEIELDNAMLLGSDRSNVMDSELQLGRFGLGLKTASLSQCRQFTVVTKQGKCIFAMTFDVDYIVKNNVMALQKLDAADISNVPEIERLNSYDTGTLVVWKKFDSIISSTKDFETTFRAMIAEAKKHVELVFHRFYDDVEIFFNDLRIERRDPFLIASGTRRQTGRVQENEDVVIIPYSLPYANSLTKEEKDLLGNPKSIYDDQGFYIYRNKRLIIWGSWMYMAHKSELNKLARIQVDIPSTLDQEWALDVKKSSARIPDKVKDLLRVVVKDASRRSTRTIEEPVKKERENKQNIWIRSIERDGEVRYQINKDNFFVKKLYLQLDVEKTQLLDLLLTNLEYSLPKLQICFDAESENKIINGTEKQDDEVLIKQLLFLLEDEEEICKEGTLDRLLDTEMYHSLKNKKSQIMERIGRK